MQGLPAAQQLFEITRAYPGHVDNVVRYLLEGGKAEDTKVSLPDLDRGAALDAHPRDFASCFRAAAVLGIEPWIDVLRAMVPSDVLDRALADAEMRGLLVRDEEFAADVHEPARARDRLTTPPPPMRGARCTRKRPRRAPSCRSTSACSATTTTSPGMRARPSSFCAAPAITPRTSSTRLARASSFYRALLSVRAAVLSGEIEDGADAQFVALSVKLADVLRTRGETARARGILAEARDWSSTPRFSAMIDRASAAISLSQK